MALGQSMSRACPDQSKYEAERLAYIDKAMKNTRPKDQPKPVAKASSSALGIRGDFANYMMGLAKYKGKRRF